MMATTTLIVTNWVPATLEQEPDQLIHIEHDFTTPEQLIEALHNFAIANSIGPVSWDWLVERINGPTCCATPPAGISKWWTQKSNMQVVEEGTYL
jgi:hypothetical protein